MKLEFPKVDVSALRDALASSSKDMS
jgi:hypothetical protein